jgi:hypothetical protein
MDTDKKELLVTETLASLGNSDYIGCYITYYADQIIRNEENAKCLIKAPNYYAWLSAASEYIYYKIRVFHFFKHDAPEFFEESYYKITNKLIAENKLSNDQKDAIYLFAKIRHLIVHKGFPNTHEEPAKSTKHPISHEQPFDADEVQKLCKQIELPSEFTNLQEKFKLAINAILTLQANISPKDYSNGFIGFHPNKNPPTNGSDGTIE